MTSTLDPLDRKIIHALYVDGRASFSRIAAALGVSEQTVARRYRSLHGAGVVRVVAQLDTGRLGQSDWALRIRCIPGVSPSVAEALARRSDVSWVQLTSGGTEIVATARAYDEGSRRALLLDHLPAGGRISSLEAHRVLHEFFPATPVVPGLGSPMDRAELAALAPAVNAAREDCRLFGPEDRPLLDALTLDGRATYRRLAEQTHWHESTVRRRLEDLVAGGMVYFDIDLDFEAIGVSSRVILWISVSPQFLLSVGRALSEHRQIPHVAATTGPTNLMATAAFGDDASFFDYLTGELSALEGVLHVETSPVIRAVKRHATMDPSWSLEA